MQYPVAQCVRFSSTFHSSLSCSRKGKEEKGRATVIHGRLAHICDPVNTNKNRLIAYYFSCDSRNDSLELVVTAFLKKICCELENLATIFGSHLPAL